MKRPVALLIPLILMPGCQWLNDTLGWGPGRPGADDDEPIRIDTVRWDTADRQPELVEFDPIINSINPRCEVEMDGDSFTMSVVGGAWYGSVTLDIHATGDDDRLESFRFPDEANIARCPDGSCDEWEHRVVQGDVYNDAAATMTVDCDDLRTNELGHYTGAAFRIVATPSAPVGDQCAMWGHRAREMFGANCECFDAYLPNPPGDPCGNNP